MDDDAQRLLAVFAHPDDESFMAGGTLALYAERGWDVRVVSATRGEAGRRGSYSSLSTAEFARLRSHELEAACKALGIGAPDFLDIRDGAVARYVADLRAPIINLLRAFEPHLVITFGPDGISGHADHLAVHAFVSAAFYAWLDLFEPMRRHGHCDEPRLFYVLRSAMVPACCRPVGPAPPSPTTAVDVARVGDRKLAAIRCHRSQSHLHPATEADIQVATTSPEYFHRAYPAWPENRVELETSLDDTSGFTDRTEDAHSSCSAGDRPAGAVQL